MAEADFTELTPAEFAADLVIMVGEPARLGVVVEVQLGRDEGKRYSWPHYAVALRARRRCPALVLVLAPDPGVAEWAGTPIGLGPGSVFQPLVVGPRAIPRLTSVVQAREQPELGVLSALAHRDDLAVLMAMLSGLDSLPEASAKLYYDLVTSRLAESMRRALEESMFKGKYEYQSDFARKYVAEGVAQGRREEASRLVLRQLARQVGLPGEALQSKVESLDLDRLEALFDAIPGLKTSNDLEAWLAT